MVEMVGAIAHGFGASGSLSRGAEEALSEYALISYVDRQVRPVGMGNPVPTAADLPDVGSEVGEARLAQDTLILWVWDGDEWLDMGTMRGPIGEPPTLSVGTVTLLPPGSTPTFTLVGESPNYTLNVGLPSGVKGDTGDTGAGLRILGVKSNTGELPTSGNAVGDAYMVRPDLYVWDGAAWQNAGPLGSTAWGDITGKPSTFTPSAHSHQISEVTSLQAALDGKVPTSRTVNGKPLTGNVTLTPADIGAPAKPTTPFVVQWTGSAWSHTSLTAAQNAGLVTGQMIWFVGGTAAPSWARPGDVFSPGGS